MSIYFILRAPTFWDPIRPFFDSLSVQIQSWINGAIDSITKTISGWISDLWNKVEDLSTWINTSIVIPLGKFITAVEQSFSSLGKSVSDGISGLSKSMQDFSNGIVGGIVNFLSNLWNNLSTAVGNGIAAISAGIGDLSKSMQDWSNSVVTSIENGAKWLGESLASGLGVLNTAIQQWGNQKFSESIGATKKGSDDIMSNLKNTIDFIGQKVSEILSGVAEALGAGLQGMIDWLMKQLTWIASMIVGAINAVVNAVQSGINSLFTGIINTITKAMSPSSPDKELATAVNVMTGTMWKQQMDILARSHHSPMTPEEASAAAVAVVAGLVTAGAGGLIAGAAIDLAHPIKEMMASRTVREIMWMVGVPAITASIVTLPSSVGLLIPLRYALMETLQPMQAGASDIVRFAVRECFDPERLKTLLAFYPGEAYTKAMAREGYNGTWARYFWGAHWVLPPIDWLNEYHYRHDDFREMWRKYIRYEDYIPESIPWLEEVIYHPWTRVDVRRMWEMGTITEEVLTQTYRWLGYDQPHAELLTLWTKIYVSAPDLKARYKNGWISEEDVRTTLIGFGMPAERVNEFMQTFIPANKPERTKAEKDLTKTDILKLFRYGQLNLVASRDLLMALGYDNTEAGYLLALESDKMTTELKDLTTSQITKAYRYEVLTRDEAKTKLVTAGWAEAAAETLLKLEDVNLADSKVEKMRERDLSVTQIIQAVGRGLIDLATGIEYLAYLGYSEWEIDIILKLEGLA